MAWSSHHTAAWSRFIPLSVAGDSAADLPPNSPQRHEKNPTTAAEHRLKKYLQGSGERGIRTLGITLPCREGNPARKLTASSGTILLGGCFLRTGWMDWATVTPHAEPLSE